MMNSYKLFWVSRNTNEDHSTIRIFDGNGVPAHLVAGVKDIPFDLERAKAGDEYYSKEYGKVTFIGVNPHHLRMVVSATENGDVVTDYMSNLRMFPKNGKRWINIFASGRVAGTLYRSKEDAWNGRTLDKYLCDPIEIEVPE